MLCRVGRPLSVSAWLSAPVLFTAAVLGLTGAGGLVLRATWAVTLSSWLGGAAAAVATALAGSVNWRSPVQRVALSVGYPAGLLGLGLVSDAVAVPLGAAAAVGIPAAAVLVVLVVRQLMGESASEARHAR
ncbi:hypothetical protein [Actinokineospora spheciospongiae]|uniref:hypothetical protein n=1 Tax=Actinokineospora spheciospongiae TaxID=909613 RepID=UPI0007C73395|nr:hypothetical protein [Actinokineospora spheciospongiae]